jgi:uncharacterized damage-inducible protein DinB
MYTQAMEFLEDERAAWEPFEQLAELSDEELDRPSPADGPAHGWTARDLLVHMLAWQELALDVARELAVDDASATFERVDREWDARGDAMNEELHAPLRALPPDELRRRAREVPGELRGTLTTVPEARWLKHPRHAEFAVEWLLDHYEEHRAELDALVGPPA